MNQDQTDWRGNTPDRFSIRFVLTEEPRTDWDSGEYVEYAGTYDSAVIRREQLKERRPDLLSIEIEPWSKCKRDGCRAVPEYGMIYCDSHRS